jgi:hypothetical protein
LESAFPFPLFFIPLKKGIKKELHFKRSSLNSDGNKN